MPRTFILLLTSLLLSTQAAQACGRRCHYRGHRPRAVVAAPTVLVAAQPTSASPASAYASTATPAPVATPQPSYAYQPEPGQAYYYTYDESGKLIVVQWMDWLFRGGKEAGMPRPPLPIVGYLQRR